MLSSSVSTFPSLSKTHRSNVLSKSFVFGQEKNPVSKQFIFFKNHSSYISTKECLCLLTASANMGSNIGGESVI